MLCGDAVFLLTSSLVTTDAAAFSFPMTHLRRGSARALRPLRTRERIERRDLEFPVGMTGATGRGSVGVVMTSAEEVEGLDLTTFDSRHKSSSVLSPFLKIVHY